MRIMLCALAAGLMAAAPLHMAYADDHDHDHHGHEQHEEDGNGEWLSGDEDSAYDEVFGNSSEEGAAAPEMRAVMLAAGVPVYLDDTAAFIRDDAGELVAAPDGDHILADGTTITISGGQVTAGMPDDDSAAVFEDAADAEEAAELIIEIDEGDEVLPVE